VPEVTGAAGPLYLAIADALATDVARGRLRPGTRLPPQRELAEALGVNLTTVTRGLAEARRRGLVEATVGRGTFVAVPPRGRPWGHLPGEEARGFVDLTFNVPPEVGEPDLGRALAETLAALARSPGACGDLLPYAPTPGRPADREAGAEWIARRGWRPDPSRLLVCVGAQHALAVALAALCGPRDVVLCEDLTYPGTRTLAATLHLRLEGVATDAEGIVPEAFEAAVRRHRPRALFCCPTLQNPTASILPTARREAIVAIARAHGVTVVEDDAYGYLPAETPPCFAALAPDVTVHVAGFSKSVAPGLRVGYLVAPDRASFDRFDGALRSTAWMTPPLMAGVAAAWVGDGTAEASRVAVRRALEERWEVAAAALAGLPFEGHPASPHLWVPLPAERPDDAFAAAARRHGVGVVAGHAFRAPGDAPARNGVRVCLGAPPSGDDLRRGLEVLAGLVREASTASAPALL
jgi:DNA-binding transcriptional MocR family regulator